MNQDKFWHIGRRPKVIDLIKTKAWDPELLMFKLSLVDNRIVYVYYEKENDKNEWFPCLYKDGKYELTEDEEKDFEAYINFKDIEVREAGNKYRKAEFEGDE